MARIFTTKFAFNHQVYDAIVTMITNEGKLNFTVKVLDNDLHQLLPGGHVNYEGRQGFKNLQMNNQMAEALVQCIANSIEHHLVVQP
jgi:hypothetical protein